MPTNHRWFTIKISLLCEGVSTIWWKIMDICCRYFQCTTFTKWWALKFSCITPKPKLRQSGNARREKSNHYSYGILAQSGSFVPYKYFMVRCLPFNESILTHASAAYKSFSFSAENDISKQEQLSMRILVACWTDPRQAAQCVHSLDQLLLSTRCMV